MPHENHKRNEQIFEDVIRGATWKVAADAAGLTAARAQQIVHKMRRMMLHPNRIGNDAVPPHNSFLVVELRQHADFWLAQLAKWKMKYGSNSKLPD